MKHKRDAGRSSRIIIWVLSVIVAISMACSFVTYLKPAKVTPTPTPLVTLTPTPTTALP
jgi:hypothetical protein